MRRGSATTRLTVDAYLVLQEVVGVLYEPECGVDTRASGAAVRIVASCRASADNCRSELVIVFSIFVKETRLAMISSG